MVFIITGNNQWENCISSDFNFRCFSGPQNSRKLEPTINNDFTVFCKPQSDYGRQQIFPDFLFVCFAPYGLDLRGLWCLTPLSTIFQI